MTKVLLMIGKREKYTVGQNYLKRYNFNVKHFNFHKNQLGLFSQNS